MFLKITIAILYNSFLLLLFLKLVNSETPMGAYEEPVTGIVVLSAAVAGNILILRKTRGEF